MLNMDKSRDEGVDVNNDDINANDVNLAEEEVDLDRTVSVNQDSHLSKTPSLYTLNTYRSRSSTEFSNLGPLYTVKTRTYALLP